MVVHSKWSFKRSGRLLKFDCSYFPSCQMMCAADVKGLFDYRRRRRRHDGGKGTGSGGVPVSL